MRLKRWLKLLLKMLARPLGSCLSVVIKSRSQKLSKSTTFLILAACSRRSKWSYTMIRSSIHCWISPKSCRSFLMMILNSSCQSPMPIIRLINVMRYVDNTLWLDMDVFLHNDNNNNNSLMMKMILRVRHPPLWVLRNPHQPAHPTRNGRAQLSLQQCQPIHLPKVTRTTQSRISKCLRNHKHHGIWSVFLNVNLIWSSLIPLILFLGKPSSSFLLQNWLC